MKKKKNVRQFVTGLVLNTEYDHLRIKKNRQQCLFFYVKSTVTANKLVLYDMDTLYPLLRFLR